MVTLCMYNAGVLYLEFCCPLPDVVERLVLVPVSPEGPATVEELAVCLGLLILSHFVRALWKREGGREGRKDGGIEGGMEGGGSEGGKVGGESKGRRERSRKVRIGRDIGG